MPVGLRYLWSVILGWVVAIGVVAGIEKFGHMIYPPPMGLDVNNNEAMLAYMDALPIGALLFVLVAWFCGAFFGGVVCVFFSKAKAMMFSIIIGAIVLLGALTSLIFIPHPIWFSIVALLGLPIVVAFTGYFSQRFERHDLQ